MITEVLPLMPPLLEEEIYVKSSSLDQLYAGSSCENVVASHLLFSGYNVALPQVDTGIDLLVEKEHGNWYRAQVKKVTHRYRKRELKTQLKEYDVYYFPYNGSTYSLSQNNVDYFYHVLKTSLRELIWEIPSNLVPTRDDGSFIYHKDVILDTISKRHTEPDIDVSKYLISSKYDQKIINTYSHFFNKHTINNFIIT